MLNVVGFLKAGNVTSQKVRVRLGSEALFLEDRITNEGRHSPRQARVSSNVKADRTHLAREMRFIDP